MDEEATPVEKNVFGSEAPLPEWVIHYEELKIQLEEDRKRIQRLSIEYILTAAIGTSVLFIAILVLPPEFALPVIFSGVLAVAIALSRCFALIVITQSTDMPMRRQQQKALERGQPIDSIKRAFGAKAGVYGFFAFALSFFVVIFVYFGIFMAYSCAGAVQC